MKDNGLLLKYANDHKPADFIKLFKSQVHDLVKSAFYDAGKQETEMNEDENG